MCPDSRLGTVLSRATHGLDAPPVHVEAHLGAGLPAFLIVGLPEAAVRESKERVRAALLTAGFDFPAGRITVNLSPADLPKQGGRFDLPIAISILAAAGRVPGAALREREFYGELALSGALRETAKLLPSLIAGAREGRELIVPEANVAEARLLPAARLRVAADLIETCGALRGERPLRAAAVDPARPGAAAAARAAPDLAEIRGQFRAKRALEVAAAGDHGLLMIGPPGSGKTMLAQRLPGLLPGLRDDEALEVASLASAAGARPSLSALRPFRCPQHTASISSLIGGRLRPGELSLAHLGVLFLDELPEFPRNALEALREPLESGTVILARIKDSCEFPARFQLVAAMNPCPCGYAGDATGRCGCSATQVRRYRERISGPLLDRIDLHVELKALPAAELLADEPAQAETSAAVAARVAAARTLQMQRQGRWNARLAAGETVRICRLDRSGRNLAESALARLGLSARAYHRVLRVARTCADLAGEPGIGAPHVAEAVQLRLLDRVTC